jgi:hypothetical protein
MPVQTERGSWIMTEEERNEDTREQADPIAQKLAELCDALGVDPLSDGWLEGCVAAAKRYDPTESEAERELGEIFMLSEKLAKSEEELSLATQRAYEASLKAKQAEARVAELDQELRKEREKADRVRDRQRDPRVVEELTRMLVANYRRADALVEAVKKVGGDPSCHICGRGPQGCTCQRVTHVPEPDIEPSKGDVEDARERREREVKERAREPNITKERVEEIIDESMKYKPDLKRYLNGGRPKGPCTDPTKMHGYADQFGGTDDPRPDPAELENRHREKVKWSPGEERVAEAAARLDARQKENRRRLGAMESTVAQGVHEFAKRLKSMQASNPLDEVHAQVREANSRALSDLPDWTSPEDLKLRLNLAELGPGTSWGGRGPRANVVAFHPANGTDDGEPEVEYQLNADVKEKGALAPHRMAKVTAFFERFPDRVYLGPERPE